MAMVTAGNVVVVVYALCVGIGGAESMLSAVPYPETAMRRTPSVHGTATVHSPDAKGAVMVSSRCKFNGDGMDSADRSVCGFRIWTVQNGTNGRNFAGTSDSCSSIAFKAPYGQVTCNVHRSLSGGVQLGQAHMAWTNRSDFPYLLNNSLYT